MIETLDNHSVLESNASKRQKTLHGGNINEKGHAKRKHQSLSISQKIDICKQKDSNPGLKNSELAIQ
jgi:hypothetical protein